jgi:hypothetical protein
MIDHVHIAHAAELLVSGCACVCHTMIGRHAVSETRTVRVQRVV